MSEDGWEDDDMADLFSFGTDHADAAPPPVEQTTAVTSDSAAAEGETPGEDSSRQRTHTDDSFLDLLEEADKPVDVALSAAAGEKGATVVMDDKETQDILNWLDEEETDGDDILDLDGGKVEKSAPETAVNATTTGTVSTDDQPSSTTVESEQTKEDTNKTEPSTDDAASPSEPAPSLVSEPMDAVSVPSPAPKPIIFDTLEDALHHHQANVEQIRSLFVQGGMKVDSGHRAQLWCRTVCSGKTLEQVSESSVADSFVEWREHHQKSGNVETNDDAHTQWIRKESSLLAERIVTCDPNRTLEDAKRDLCDVLLFHYQSSAKQTKDEDNDPLMPPVACALLTAGIPSVAASVMLSNIMPAFMPLLALTQDERWEAAKSLHSQFYLLACYHLPLLVFHLDRYAPGWHWPKSLNADDSSHDSTSATQKSRNLQRHGVVPQSWLVSHLAGECGGTLMNPKWLLSLWDLILTSSNNSLRFFLSLAVLEKYSDHLLMMTGSALVDELNRIMEFKEGTTLEGFAIEGDDETSDSDAVDWVQDWCNRAQTLWEATPRTVVSRLRSAEDEAVQKALFQRQKAAEEKLKARLEAEAKAYQEAEEIERERKADEARQRLTKARLTWYYRKYNPEKEGNVDRILQTYEGRLDLLDRKLKAKYGHGFNPAIKPKSMNATASMLLSSVNQGLTKRRSQVSQDHRQESKEPDESSHQVTVAVSATELLPIICWSKEAAACSGTQGLARGRYSEERAAAPLKFYLIDSRPETTVEQQGRFPTSVSMSPEDLLDPDRMSQQEEIFESLRGAVHICVMGEGYSSIPALYGQKETDNLRELIAEDDSRTSLCALFFVKKGFPFVSILEGGFVQAHSWLCREGPNRQLNASSVLVDYDAENSLFAQMESAYRERQEFANLPSGEKATRVMQNLFDASMTSLTRQKYRIEKMATRVEASEEQPKAREPGTGSVSTKFFAKKEGQEEDTTHETAVLEPDQTQSAEGGTGIDEEGMVDVDIDPDKAKEASKKGLMFRNPFAGRRQVASSDSVRVDDTAVDFAPVQEKIEEQAPPPPPPTPPSTPLQSPFARFGRATSKGSEEEDEEALKQNDKSKSSVGLSNRLVGLGAKRNPFARFGNKENGTADGDDTKSNRFAGINQLRLNTLSNLRGKPAPDEVRTASDAAEVEESISFFENESPVAAAAEKKEDESNKSFDSALSAESNEGETPAAVTSESEDK